MPLVGAVGRGTIRSPPAPSSGHARSLHPIWLASRVRGHRSRCQHARMRAPEPRTSPWTNPWTSPWTARPNRGRRRPRPRGVRGQCRRPTRPSCWCTAIPTPTRCGTAWPARLGERFHVVAHDVRGAGASGVPATREGYDLDHLVADIGAVVDAVSPAPPCTSWATTGAPFRRGRPSPAAVSTVGSRTYTSMSGTGLDHVAHWMRARRTGRRRYRRALPGRRCTPGTSPSSRPRAFPSWPGAP